MKRFLNSFRRILQTGPVSGTTRPRPGRRPFLEVLESRCLPSVFTVLNTFDSGPGSLRQAILDNNKTPSLNTIGFNIQGKPLFVIYPETPLPVITNPVIVDGATQPGYVGQPVIILSGLTLVNNGVSGGHGLGIVSGKSTLRALEIDGFPTDPQNPNDEGVGIELSFGGGNLIENCQFRGKAVPNVFRSQEVGIKIDDTCSNNLIRHNIILGNSVGVEIAGSGTASNRVIDNLIGTLPGGIVPAGNDIGVSILSGAANNTIGGTAPGTGNLISANFHAGVSLRDTTGNEVLGNLIGTNFSGRRGLRNETGIEITAKASFNTIGGTASGAGNVIFSHGAGVSLTSGSNTIQGNFIGTDVNGDPFEENGTYGVFIDTNANNNLIGGTAAGAGNIISAQNVSVGIRDSGNNVVQGNRIGSGLRRFQGATGVSIVGTMATSNLIGGTAPGAGNVISGQLSAGVEIFKGASNNSVQGNRIGSQGINAIGNQTGVDVADAMANTIGGTAFGAGNLISGNLLAGVVLRGSSTSFNQVQNNLIGTDASGQKALGNELDGVDILLGASNNLIGGTSGRGGNVISGNGRIGISIANQGTSGNLVQGNLIGTDSFGAFAIPNKQRGVLIAADATGNQVGGPGLPGLAGAGPTAGNVISGNGGYGVEIVGSGTMWNIVVGNLIGTNLAGTAALPNLVAGVEINGASHNVIGGPRPDGPHPGIPGGPSQVISGNGRYGVTIEGPSTDNLVEGNFIGLDAFGAAALGNGDDGVNTVQGNWIGTDSTGVNARGNLLAGVHVLGQHNLIGGTMRGARNLISGNQGDGVLLEKQATGNKVQGNWIGTDITGNKALGNKLQGVAIRAGASGNQVGGARGNLEAGSATNVISGNVLNGVRLDGAGTKSNFVQGNFIGTNFSGLFAVPNGQDGVLLDSGAASTLVGGTANFGNIISGNHAAGLELTGSQTRNNHVQGNLIGPDRSNVSPIGNAGDGVVLRNGTSGNHLDTGNVISGNAQNGLVLEGKGTDNNYVQGNFIGTNSNNATTLSNALDGVLVSDQASNNLIGGTTAAERNVISGNGSNGVQITGAGTRANQVQGNYIGTTTDGNFAFSNVNDGVLILSASDNTVGGTAPGAGNLISGNFQAGVSLLGVGTTANQIQGNLIGVNPTQSAPVGNGGPGVRLSNGASGNLVGGAASGAGNVISGNGAYGVLIGSANSHGNVIQGNDIGTDSGGTLPLGNASDGVAILGASTNSVGGRVPGAGNVIAFNGGTGVRVFVGTSNAILSNSIFANANQGIRLVSGGNQMENAPALASASSAGSTTITGTLASVPNSSFTIQFFASPVGDPSGFGQGKVFLGSIQVTTDNTGKVDFSASLTVAVPAGFAIAATATDPLDNTSAFSNWVTVS